jgi:hypothetical protein
LKGPCLRCGRFGEVVRHHLTLRGDDGAYLHEWLWALLDPDCHRGQHNLLQRAGLEVVETVTSSVVLGRVAAFLVWMAWPWPGRPELVSIPPEVMAGIARVIEENVRSLSELVG